MRSRTLLVVFGLCSDASAPLTTVLRMREMFLIYLAFITSGVTYFAVIGLTHH